MIVAYRPAVGRIDPIEIQSLATRVLGTVFQPGDDGYNLARLTHDPAVDRYPALVVQARDVADVIRAVEFAREQGLTLAVRSGGHSLAGYGSVDGGLVLDLSAMDAVSVDPVRQTAWVQPGATTARLLAHTQPFGLALSTGDTASVGIGGLTLGGGIGWLVRKHGLTIDSLLSAEIVTADGQLIVASAQEHPELFWALRGGGGNFGVATGFEFRLAPVSTILGGALVLPPTREVLRGYADYALHAPDELTTIAMLMPLPPLPSVPAEMQGQLAFMVLIAYAGDLTEGQRVVDPLRALATPIADLTGPMPYPALYEFTAMAAERHSARIRSGFMRELSDEAIATILDHAGRNPSPGSMVQLRALGGAMARVPKEATAFVHRDAAYLVAVIHMGDADEARAWTETLWQALRPQASGVYVNFLEAEGDERVREAYPTPIYDWLAEVKRHYDPTNLFRLNQNIKPAE